jgi:PilZ domain-containing protein
MRSSHAVKADSIERRRQPRHETPIRITLGRETAVCVNWSAGGFLVRGFKNLFHPGEQVAGLIEVAGVTRAFAAKVLRANPQRHEIGAKFVELDPDTVAAMELLHPA